MIFIISEIDLLLFVWHYPYEFINQFLILPLAAAIIIYNTVVRCNMPVAYGELPKALPNTELSFVIPEGIHMEVSYAKLWRLLVDKINCVYIDPACNIGDEDWVCFDNVRDPKIIIRIIYFCNA